MAARLLLVDELPNVEIRCARSAADEEWRPPLLQPCLELVVVIGDRHLQVVRKIAPEGQHVRSSRIGVGVDEVAELCPHDVELEEHLLVRQGLLTRLPPERQQPPQVEVDRIRLRDDLAGVVVDEVRQAHERVRLGELPLVLGPLRGNPTPGGSLP
eukprot:CAMPEP_0176053342 /NCGR_PEP_ID=MMETSP0120_2-20121206/26532_1 /TAXON_ID=160619 /ORGANISM="Kryptoperidinium foliaceum, Strain CCMP 1326" /LENGTH=155 /DNA_ID=CAMNT_0017386797 /DNA_START=108 /DNA_END=572 /DNA_ORIENTATION=-